MECVGAAAIRLGKIGNLPGRWGLPATEKGVRMHRNKFWGPTSVWGSLGLQIFLAGLPIFQPGALLPAQEIVDTRFLGEKGVVFESPFTWVASDSTQAHGVGDFNGDGFDDLLPGI
jgi:hypothetical protein